MTTTPNLIEFKGYWFDAAQILSIAPSLDYLDRTTKGVRVTFLNGHQLTIPCEQTATTPPVEQLAQRLREHQRTGAVSDRPSGNSWTSASGNVPSFTDHVNANSKDLINSLYAQLRRVNEALVEADDVPATKVYCDLIEQIRAILETEPADSHLTEFDDLKRRLKATTTGYAAAVVQLARVKSILAKADHGAYATSSRDFGRGVRFVTEHIHAALGASEPIATTEHQA